jgi:hypothetical protein
MPSVLLDLTESQYALVIDMIRDKAYICGQT